MNLLFFLFFIFCLIFGRLVVRLGGLSQDEPNDRSSHRDTTPRGGGITFVISAFALYYTLLLFEVIPHDKLLENAVVIPSFIIFILGLFEDSIGVKTSVRFLVEILAGILVLYMGMAWKNFDFLGASFVLPGFLAAILTVLWLVWNANLYNFMDGINGISTLQAIVMGSTYAVLCHKFNLINGYYLCVAMTIATMAFLPLNFPRAKIFMGDCGSLFLGFFFASLALYMHTNISRFTLNDALLAIAPFFFDTTMTLLRRLIHGEKIIEAHRTHYYQTLSQIMGNHSIPAIIYFTLGLVSSCLVLFSENNTGVILGWYVSLATFFFAIHLYGNKVKGS